MIGKSWPSYAKPGDTEEVDIATRVGTFIQVATVTRDARGCRPEIITIGGRFFKHYMGRTMTRRAQYREITAEAA